MLHYRFLADFRNPASGNEKDNVENKAGYSRRNAFDLCRKILRSQISTSLTGSGAKRMHNAFTTSTKFYRDPELMHWGSGRCVRFDAKGHRVADWEQAVKGFATLDCLLPICCMVAKASMAKPRMPAIQFLFHSGVDVANFLGDLLRHFSLDEHTQNIT